MWMEIGVLISLAGQGNPSKEEIVYSTVYFILFYLNQISADECEKKSEILSSAKMQREKPLISLTGGISPPTKHVLRVWCSKRINQ